MSGRAQRASLLVAAVAAAWLAGTAGAAGVAEPFGGLVAARTASDRDGDRVFDALERRLAAGGRFEVLVALDRPGSPQLLDELTAATGIEVRQVFRSVDGFAALATESQVRELARDPRVVHVEGGAAGETFDVSSLASFGVTRARMQVPGLDGDRDGDPAAYSTGDLVAAVVDTGIDAGHADLDGGKVLAFADCRDLVAGCKDAAPGDDALSGHGTHVAATLAGDHGVAPGAALVGVRVLDPRSPSASDKARMLAGVDWVIAHRAQYGIDVLNLSVGIPVDGPFGEGCSAGLDLLSQAAEAASAAGILVVAAAGNSGPGACTVGSPAAAPSVLTVGNIADLGAVGEAEGRPVAGFRLHVSSSRGPTADGRTKPDLVAPGVEITSAAAGTANGSWDGTGTSAAAPFVAGTALLMEDAAPGLTAAQVKSLLVASAVDWGPPGADPDYGAGRLDAFAAIRAAGAPTAGAPAVPMHQVVTGHLDEGEPRDVALDVTDAGYPVAATLLVPAATTAGPNLDLELRDPQGAVVASSTRVPGTSPQPGWPVWSGRQEELGVMPAGTGSYTLRVRAVAGGADYVLDVSRGPAPPVRQTAPSVTGSAVEGSVLTGVPGTWEGSAWTLGSQWLRCPGGQASCEPIAGAGLAYTAVPADVGSRLLFRTTATNGAGTVGADAPLTAVVAGRPPSLVSPPAVTGTFKVGGTVSASTGLWSGTAPLSYRIRWLRCGPGPTDDCVLDGTEGAQRTLPTSYVDARLEVVVTASNGCTPGCGSGDATSEVSGVVAGLPPQAAVSITGTPRVGETLQAATGASFLGVPQGTIESYGWFRCPETGPCVEIDLPPTGPRSEYTLTPADLGFRIRVHVAIGNTCLAGCGGSGADSALTGVVAPPAPPEAEAAPAVLGIPEDGRLLTASDGTWSGFQPIAVARQWRRCDAAGTGCVDLAGETATTLLLGEDEVGGTIRLHVSATNAGGTVSADSAPSALVAARPPSGARRPTVVGTARRDVPLEADVGSWSGTRPIAFELTWLRCRKACTALDRHGETYTPVPDDVGARLVLRVRATNAGGSATQDSAPTAAVAPAAAIVGDGQADALTGTRWADVLRGLGGADRLRGLAGADRLSGGTGADSLDGGAGNDVLDGGSGGDALAGGPGADRVEARDGHRDSVACGPGADTARVDRSDRVTGCEHVLRPRLAKQPAY